MHFPPRPADKTTATESPSVTRAPTDHMTIRLRRAFHVLMGPCVAGLYKVSNSPIEDNLKVRSWLRAGRRLGAQICESLRLKNSRRIYSVYKFQNLKIKIYP